MNKWKEDCEDVLLDNNWIVDKNGFIDNKYYNSKITEFLIYLNDKDFIYKRYKGYVRNKYILDEWKRRCRNSGSLEIEFGRFFIC